jgi:GNAT superfamily N-acetyltransferase
MEFDIRPTTEADWPRIWEIMQAQLPETPSLETVIRSRQNPPPGLIAYELGAYTPEGRLIGYGGADAGPFRKPGHFRIYVRVDEAYRRQGIGTALFAQAERFALEQQAAVLEASVREDVEAGQAFAERKGFAKIDHIFESRLDLSEFDPAPLQGARAAADAFRFISLADLPQDDESLQRFLDYLNELAQDVPGAAGVPPITMEQFRFMEKNDPHFDPSGIILAVDGDRWAALAFVQRQDNGSYYNSLTGVHRDYRGRGLALSIKLISIEYVQSRGGTYLRTNNHSQNQRMLAVNRKLGYQPEPGFFHMERQVVR